MSVKDRGQTQVQGKLRKPNEISSSSIIDRHALRHTLAGPSSDPHHPLFVFLAHKFQLHISFYLSFFFPHFQRLVAHLVAVVLNYERSTGTR